MAASHTFVSAICSMNRRFASLILLCGLLWGINSVSGQYRPQWPSPLVQQEIFLLNLEDGYFGCQVNESQDVLQLFELSKLCDGVPQCFRGSDELHEKLKCSDRSEYSIS